MVALLLVALALGLNNFAGAIASGVSGVDRMTGLKVAAVFGLWDVVMPAAGLLVSGAALSLDDFAVGLALAAFAVPLVAAVITFGVFSAVLG
jgi:putative Mn2+ efflux pump MntP